MNFQMDLPNIFNKFLCFQHFSCDVFPHSSFISINNIQGRRWKISKETFKRGLTGRSKEFSGIRVLNIDNIFILGLWMLLIIIPPKMHQRIVDYFYLPIYLWMECCISLQLHVHLLLKFSLKIIEKYGIHV
jgi:hypothetical protein